LSFPANSASIAIIIDDMGNTNRDSAAFALPTEVVFSILPLKALSSAYSKKAAQQKREVMLHMPMESLAGKQLGPGAITSDMQSVAIRETLLSALNSVPNAIGLNNHMGSKLTQLTQPMTTTMMFLHQHDMFFVDSRTTRYTKAESIAVELGVLATKRNVFLDHSVNYESIDEQFERLIRLSLKYGFAVGIAHPYPQTVEYLKSALPTLQTRNIRLVTVSEIIKLQLMTKAKNLDNHKLMVFE
jgi:polysaccharide deacetylase 2 family uncharacterized protein YibQ